MLAVTLYTWLKSFHVFFAVVWVGGALLLQVLAFFALRSKLPGRKAEFAGEAEWVATRLFVPSSLAVLGLGFWLIAEGNWDYDLWIILALLGFAFSFVSGIAYLTPQTTKIHQAIETQGPDAPEVADRIDRTLIVSRIELVILIFLVFDMIIKPGT